MRYRADQIQLLIHGKDPRNHDINWLLAAPKLQKITHLLWKSILGAWMNVRAGFEKTKPTFQADVLRQPISSNPLITNAVGLPLRVSGLSEGQTITKVGCTRVKDTSGYPLIASTN